MTNSRTSKIICSCLALKRIYLYIGSCLFLLGASLLLCFPAILQFVLKHALTFKPGWNAYENWVMNSEPYIFDVYLFNWTNPQNFYDRNVKPRFEEIGPYRYHLYMVKMNTSKIGENTLRFNMAKKYIFVKEDDSRDLDDLITSINPIPLSLAYQYRYASYFTKLAISLTLRSTQSEMFITKTANEWLFKGFNEATLDMASKLPFASVKDRFGYFYKKNYTDSLYGPFDMHDVVDDDFGLLSMYEYKKNPGYFRGECGKVKGGTGDFVEMDRNRSKSLDIFVPEICTFTKLYYMRQQEFQGILSDVYEVPTNLFDNGTTVLENQCFCNGDCVPSGLLNASSCNENAPLFFSLPHFHYADPYYRNAVEGMKPNPKKHVVYTAYQRDLGVATSASIQLQINILVQPIKGIGMFSDVPRYFIPVFYISEKLELSEKIVDRLSLVQSSPSIFTVFSAALITLGFGFVFIPLVTTKKNKKSYINNNLLFEAQELKAMHNADE